MFTQFSSCSVCEYIAKSRNSNVSLNSESNYRPSNSFLSPWSNQNAMSPLAQLINALVELLSKLNETSPPVQSDENVFKGTEGNDVIKGSDKNDVIRSGRGDDVIRSGKGNDVIYSGRGDDVVRSGKGDDVIYSGRGDDVVRSGKGNDVVYSGSGDDIVRTGKGNDVVYSGKGNDTIYADAGNDTIYAGKGRDTIHLVSGSHAVDGGQGEDTAVFKARPIDYRFTQDESGQLTVTNADNKEASTLLNTEALQFGGVDGKSYTAGELLDNKFLTDRNDISIYGDTTQNRLVVMRLSTMELLQEIPVDGEKVYSTDYVTEDKSYITPRGSNFFQVLNRNDVGEFELGKEVELPFSPRTPNRNRENGLVLYSGADKAMWALVDSNTDDVVASGGRNEVTQGTIGNYDSEWATGHAQWVSGDQFLLPDRESNELSLYKVNNDTGEWKVEKTDSLILPESVHTLFGKSTDANGDVTIYAPGEGTDSQENADASLFELKISGDSISIDKEVGVSGGLHHPGVHPDGDVIYAPTSNGFVDIIDVDSYEVIDSVEAGKGAGHVVWVPERNMALIVNHGDTFMTAIDMTTHEKIKDIEVAVDDPNVSDSLQAHTGRLSPDNQYFYNFATDSGTFFRLNLDTLEVDSTVYTGGTPKQASQPGELG